MKFQGLRRWPKVAPCHGRYAWPAQNLKLRTEPKAAGSNRGHASTFTEHGRNGGNVRHNVKSWAGFQTYLTPPIRISLRTA